MAWIFSIFSLLVGCAAQSPSLQKKPSLSKKVKVRQPASPIQPGPTRPNNKPFVDVTRHMGLHNIVAAKIYAVDFNNDNYTDLVTLKDSYSPAEFYQFYPVKKIWKKIPAPFKNSATIRANFLAFADFDKDGINDVVFATFNQKTELTPQPLRLFRGSIKKNQYWLKEVPNAFPSHIDPVSSLTLLDYNLDGHLDIYVGNWYDKRRTPIGPAPDRLYKGKKFTFKDQTYLLEGELKYNRSYRNYPNARPTFGVSVCDINQDGYPDVLTSSSSGFGNRLWISQGKNSEFKDEGIASGYAFDQIGNFAQRGGGNSTFGKCADYNNDGIMDVATGEIVMSYDNKQKDVSGILTGMNLNPPIKFIRRDYYRDDGTRLNHRGDRRGVWLDYNNDGLMDLLVDNSGFPPHSRLVLFEQEPNHGFLDTSANMGIDILNPSGSISIDFNQDGNMDIITGQVSTRNNELKKRLYAFMNTHPLKGNTYRFYLRGRKSNVQGLGGTIILRSDKRFYRQAIDNTYGFFPSQNEEGIRFVLPPDEKFKFVEVHWPWTEKSRPLIQRYLLNTTTSRKSHQYTLCETGKYYPRKKISCPR